MCIVTVLSHGLRSGGGVGDVLRKPSKEVSATLISPRRTMCARVCSCCAGSCELALSPSCFEPFSSFIDSEVLQCFHTAVQAPPCNSITLQNRFPQNSGSTANDVKEDVAICHTHGQRKERWVSVIRLSPVWRADWLLKFMLTPKWAWVRFCYYTELVTTAGYFPSAQCTQPATTKRNNSSIANTLK